MHTAAHNSKPEKYSELRMHSRHRDVLMYATPGLHSRPLQQPPVASQHQCEVC